MVAVITSDIIKLQHIGAEVWIAELKNLLKIRGNVLHTWKIHREGKFKYRFNDIFCGRVAIKSQIKILKNLEVRMAVGEVYFSSEKIAKSNDSVYIIYGRRFNNFKKDGKIVAIKTFITLVDRDLNILLKWLFKNFDNSTLVLVEIIYKMIKKKDIAGDLAKRFAILQSSISQRLRRANYKLIVETNQYFRKKISKL